jgi:hypothetical protein
MGKTKAGVLAARAAKQPARAVRLSDPRMLQLTARFHEVRRTVACSSVEAAVEAGQILEEGRQELQKNFPHWVAHLRISRDTADNYLALARLEREAPVVIEKWKFLGPARMYRLAKLPPKRRQEVLKREDLGALEDAEFFELTRLGLSTQRAVTANMLGHGLYEKAKGISRGLSGFELPAAIDDPEVRKRLKGELLEVARLARGLAGKIDG